MCEYCGCQAVPAIAELTREQDGVFPAALTGLRTADWEAVDAVRARVGTAAAIDSVRQPHEQQGLTRE